MNRMTVTAHEHPQGVNGFPSVSYDLHRIGQPDPGAPMQFLDEDGADANLALDLLIAAGFTANQGRRALHDARDHAVIRFEQKVFNEFGTLWVRTL